jgi:hypothetical protein
VAMGYAPKGIINRETVCIPYIYFEKRNRKLINPSILRSFFDHRISENLKIESPKFDYHVDLLNKTSRKVAQFGGFIITSVLGIEYLINDASEPNTVGVSIESIIELSQKLIKNIIEIAIESGDVNTPKLRKLPTLIQREPKTITNILKNL